MQFMVDSLIDQEDRLIDQTKEHLQSFSEQTTNQVIW